VILGLFLVPTVTDSVFFATMTINNAPGSFASGLEVASGAWWTMLGTACNVAVILVGDALLVGELGRRFRREDVWLMKDRLGLPLLFHMVGAPPGCHRTLYYVHCIPWSVICAPTLQYPQLKSFHPPD
jgi:hypothetical protein